MNRQAASLQKQKPLKEKYRGEPGSSRITLEARASQQDTPISCSVDVGRAIYEAGAHAGVGGTGSAACSGDLAGTLGASRDFPVGFETIRTSFEVVAPKATEEQLENLRRKTEQYCVVFQTLVDPPELQTEWA